MKRSVLSFALLFLLAFPAQAASPEVIEVTSASGIKAWLIQNDRLPLISLRFAFRGGVERDPEGKQGLATLTASLLTQGAGPYDEKGFQDRLAARSIEMSVSAGRDALSGELKTLRKNKAEAFRLLSLALTKPRFDQDVFERMRAQQATAIKFQIAKPGWQARCALFQHLFAPHPYAFRSLGSPTTLDAISRADVVSFARQRLAKDNLVVAVVGSLSPEELGRALDRIFGALPAQAIGEDLPEAPKERKTQEILVRREGTQTNILFAAPMMRREDKEWAGAEIANYILGGGGFVSRLMQEVREKAGLTYGIGTGLAPMDKASLVIGEMAADNDKAVEAVKVLKKSWSLLRDEGAKPEEVEAAKDYLTGSLPLAFSSTDAASSILLGLQLDGLPKEYLFTRDAEIRAVTPERVNKVLRDWFNPTTASFVFVGKPEGLVADEERPLVEE
jgi:zinc protease